MKNVVIFQDFISEKTYGHQWQKDELYNYFKAQVDNSIDLGWDPKDICIVTNLDFEYRNVTIIKTKLLCTYNKYFNKQWGIYELLKENLIDDNFWIHDFDDWQLTKFNGFPQFDGLVGACKYLFENPIPQWNTGSIFVKKTALPIFEYIYETMETNKHLPNINQYGDENIFNICVYEHFQSIVSEIDYTYNVGCTGFKDRYDKATKPISVGAFKPNDKRDVGIFRDNVSERLIQIFKKYNLWIGNE